MRSAFLPQHSDRQTLALTYRLQTVKAFFQGYCDELGSFWTSRKNQKSGKENRKESKAATGNKGSFLQARRKIAPTIVESRDSWGIEDYRKKSCIPILYGLPIENFLSFQNLKEDSRKAHFLPRTLNHNF